ncbi:MAG: hypothetical protein WCJ37_05825 [Syntrophus sp. (in: bacteria)]
MAAGKCSLYTSTFAHEEAVRNILKKAPDKFADLSMLMQQVDILPEPHPQWVIRAAQLPLAAKDAPVLAAALQGRYFCHRRLTRFRQSVRSGIGRGKFLTPADSLEAVGR